MKETIEQKAKRYRQFPFSLQTIFEKDEDFVNRMESVFIRDLILMIENSRFDDITYSKELAPDGKIFLNVRLRVKQ